MLSGPLDLHKALIKPPALRPGDLVGVAAPAGPVKEDELGPGLDLLRSLGLEVVTGRHVYDKRGYTAGSDRARLEDLHHMLAREDIRAVFCARGGYGSMRLLPALDFVLAAGRPKVVAGYSDVTAILLAIYQRSRVVTFHGPVVKELPEKGVEDIAGILMDEQISASPMVLDLSGKGLVLTAGLARGKVLGGNLSILTHLAGTPYMPDLEGAVLFLEETGEPLYRVDRMITHLALSGVFRGLAGLLIGDFIGCGDPYAVQDLLMEHVGPLEIPVMAGFPVGHGRVNRLVPMGLEATVDTAAMRVIWHESCLSDPETAA